MERRTYAPKYCATCRAETPHYMVDGNPAEAPRCKECEIRPREADDPVATGERPINGAAEHPAIQQQRHRGAEVFSGPGVAGNVAPEFTPAPIAEFLDGIRKPPRPAQRGFSERQPEKAPQPPELLEPPVPTLGAEELVARAQEQEALLLERHRVEVLKLGLDGVFQVGAALIQGRVRDQEVHNHLASLANGFLREALDLDHD